MDMDSLKISLHSFIDVITNSSTSIYVMADKESVKTVKELINQILKKWGSDKKCDDLFEVNLVHDECYYEREDYDSDEEFKEAVALWESNDDYENRHDIDIEIKCKWKGGKSILSSMRSLFEVEEGAE